jgi:N-acetylmuramic acid 6-phosphate etherase
VDTGVESVTESRVDQHADLDLRPTRKLIELMNSEDATVAAAVRGAAGPLTAAIDAIVDRLERGGRLVYVGAGTSGRLAAMDAAECQPTFGLRPGLVVAITVTEEAAEDDFEAGAAHLAAANVGAADAVVAISASGSTPYVLGAAGAAGAVDALTVGVVCAPDSELGRSVEHEIVAVVGPEVIAGSTRLKGGTAQKLILNTISTVTMVRLGKTFGNLMIDVVASNAKLKTRARRTVELVTEASSDEADAALEAARGDAKVAIVSLLAGVSADEARLRLKVAGGNVRKSLEAR